MMRSNLKILSWNCNSLHGKLPELRDFLSYGDYDVVLLQETKLKHHLSYHIPNYTLHRKDRCATLPRTYGGVAIYVKNGITHSLVTDLKTDSLESISIIIDGPAKLMLTSAYVRHCLPFPSQDIKKIFAHCDKNIIIGDFNAHHLAWGAKRNSTHGIRLLKLLMDEHILMAYPPSPTHIVNSTNLVTQSTIDFLLHKNLHQFPDVAALQVLSSDHLPITTTINLQFHLAQRKPALKTDWSVFTSQLIAKPLHFPLLKDQHSIDLETSSFTKDILDAYEASSKPVKTTYQFRLPTDIKMLIRARNEARRYSQRTRHPDDLQRFNQLRNQVRTAIRRLQQESWASHLQSLSPDDNSIWKTIKRLTNKRFDYPPIKTDTAYAVTPHDQAETIARVYEGQFSNSENSNLAIDPLVDHIINMTTHDKIDRTVPTEVIEAIEKLKIKKCPGADCVNNAMIINLPVTFILRLTNLINAILDTKYFPSEWKKAIVCPIPKQGQDLSLPSSYRPISLLSGLGKVAERIILNRLNKFLNDNQLMLPEQFGFRSQHSTTHQLLRVVETLSEGKQKHESVAILLLDVSKAFDKVWHTGLIYKLSCMSVPVPLIQLLSNYLSGRFFMVRVKDQLSSLHPILSGVPQGSILGPTLYNVYVNDIPRHPFTELALYADDTAIIARAKKARTVQQHLQNHIDSIVLWMQNWKIKLNSTKCKAISIGTKSPPSRLQIDGCTIDWSNSATYLGVEIDKNLTWSKHINKTRGKMTGAFNGIKALIFTRKLSLNNKVLLYKALIRPLATYAAPVWAYAAKTNFKKLCAKESSLLRLIRFGHPFLSNEVILKDLRMKPLRKHIHRLSDRFYRKLRNIPNEIIAELPDYEPSDPAFRARPKAVLHSLNN